MHFHVHHHADPRLLAILGQIHDRLTSLEKTVMSGASHIQTALGNLSTSVGQLAADVGALAQIIRDNSGGNAALEDAANKIDAAVASLNTTHQAAVDAGAVPPPTPPTT